MVTTEQVLELSSDDFDASEGKESDFGDEAYLPGSCTDGLDLPGAGISQSQDDRPLKNYSLVLLMTGSKA